MTEVLKFSITTQSTHCQARLGCLQTRHHTITTPTFMPVGTLGSVKSLLPHDLEALDVGMILCNAYHLMLRPGADIIAKCNGLHDFMGYDRGILTDSGGFQVFSLASLRTLSDHGVQFRSHVDGTLIELTPEKLVHVQEQLCPDIAMVLDECPKGKADKTNVEQATRRTTHWAKRCLEARSKEEIAWFGIVQGGRFSDLRMAHAQEIATLPFDGFAIGGVSVGEDKEDMHQAVESVTSHLPKKSPRYLMGVGTFQEMVHAISCGVDMFDCVLPTRNARNGQLFTREGPVHIKNAEHRNANIPVDANCTCFTCRHFSRAYLRHLFVCKEIAYHRLATLHNIHFYISCMKQIQKDIQENRFFGDAKVYCAM